VWGLIPLPMRREGPIELHLTPIVGKSIEISASAIGVSGVGEAVYEQDIP